MLEMSKKNPTGLLATKQEEETGFIVAINY